MAVTSARGPDILIRAGHAICKDLGDGRTPSQDAIDIQNTWRGGADHGGLTPSGIPGAVHLSQASAWVTAAVVNHCPTPHPGGRVVGPGPYGVIPPTPGFNETPMNPGAQTGPWPGTGGREFPATPMHLSTFAIKQPDKVVDEEVSPMTVGTFTKRSAERARGRKIDGPSYGRCPTIGQSARILSRRISAYM